MMNLNQLLLNHNNRGQSLLNLDLDQLLHLDSDLSNIEAHNAWIPAVDIREEAKHFIVTADVPGVDKKDLDINMEDNILTIHGKRKVEYKQNKEHLLRFERFAGEFYRRFSLPLTANPNKISAEYHCGVLTIMIPKQKASSSRKIKILGE